MLTIEQIRAAVTPICERYGVNKMWLFGSYARGEADEQSDVDLLVDKGTGNKVRGFAFFGFYGDLERALGVKTDLLTTIGAGKRFLNSISKDEVLLYAR